MFAPITLKSSLLRFDVSAQLLPNFTFCKVNKRLNICPLKIHKNNNKKKKKDQNERRKCKIIAAHFLSLKHPVTVNLYDSLRARVGTKDGGK